MANRLYNKQTSPKGYKAGGRVKKMGGGMAKRKMLKAGSNGNGKKKAFGMSCQESSTGSKKLVKAGKEILLDATSKKLVLKIIAQESVHVLAS